MTLNSKLAALFVKNTRRYSTSINNDSSLLTSPAVRMLARQHQLDLRLVKGSGRKGRIHKEDIVNYLAGKRSLEAKADDKAISGNNNMQISAFTKSGTLVVKMNTLEQDMQKSMSNSLAIPHLYLHERCDVGKLQHFRRSLKDNGRKVSLLSILIKTFSLSLSQHPKLNSSYDAKSPFNYITHHNHNVSIAIDSPYGRVIPNIKHVQSLSMLKLQAELDSLHQKAHNGILNQYDLSQGTISISNLGALGGVLSCPLLLSPQICIVAVGRILDCPMFRNGHIDRKQYITMSLACDHRVVDGASVARFTKTWRDLIQQPTLALSDMV